MKLPELLSPAGSMESLIAAIEAGCDAVYLSGIHYGARSYANNFNNQELTEAVNLAHLYGVRIYVTINTLVYEAEVDNFLKYVEFLQKINVDAVIVQDIGMMDLLRQLYPSLEIHASTQMHIHNLEGVKLLEKLGIKRAVLARETSFELLEEIRKRSKLQLEIFIHGALCISYSGQCLMSSFIGGRSGNRGTCAQCCRQPYDLINNGKIINEDKYVLSMKDLNTLNNIGKLMDIGVDSLKIEGRMKRPEYVYYVTKLYRKAIDEYYKNKKISITDLEIQELMKLFNRKFTKGFLFEEKNSNIINEYRPNHLGITIGQIINVSFNRFTIKLISDLNVGDGIRIIMSTEDVGLTVEQMFKNNKRTFSATSGDIIDIVFSGNVERDSLVVITTDSKQLKNISTLIKEKKRKVEIDMHAILKVGEKIKLIACDNKNKIEAFGNFIIENSKNSPVTKEKIKEQLMKTGDTIFLIKNLKIDMDDNIFVPIKEINEIRRKLLEDLKEKRLYKLSNIIGEYKKELVNYESENKKTIMINSLEHYNEIKRDDYDELYMNESLFDMINDTRKILKIPRVIEKHKRSYVNVLIGEIGSYIYIDAIADFSLNVVNSYSVAFLHSLGINRITLSHELSFLQTKKIVDNYVKRYNKKPNLEVIVAGRLESMVMKYDILNKYNVKTNTAYLKDKYENRFEIIRENGLTYIYHYKNLNIKNPKSYYDIGINYVRY